MKRWRRTLLALACLPISLASAARAEEKELKLGFQRNTPPHQKLHARVFASPASPCEGAYGFATIEIRNPDAESHRVEVLTKVEYEGEQTFRRAVQLEGGGRARICLPVPTGRSGIRSVQFLVDDYANGDHEEHLNDSDQSMSPTVLLVRTDLNSVDAWVRLIREWRDHRPRSHAGSASDVDKTESCRPDDLPDRWSLLSGFDLVIVDMAATGLTFEHQRVLLEYAQAGGVLVRLNDPTAESASGSSVMDAVPTPLGFGQLVVLRVSGVPAEHASASMSANGHSGAIADRARAATLSRVDALGTGGRTTLILTGAHPQIGAGPEATRGEVEGFLARFEPQEPDHDRSIALDLARDLAGDGDSVLLVTDDPTLRVPGFEVVAVGEPLPNAAIVHARRVRESSGEKLFLDLKAYASSSIDTTLTIRIDGAEPLQQPVHLPNEGSRSVTLELPGDTPALEVALADDALAIDNRARLLPEPSRIVHAAILVPEEHARLLDLERVLQATDDVVIVADPAAARLVFSTAAGELRAWQTEVVIHSGPEPKSDWIGPFLLERRHALASGLALEGVVWSAPDLPLPGLPVVLAGDQSLLSEEIEGTGVRVHLAFDPARSNLCSAPDWPILIANLVASVRSRSPGPESVNLRLGEILTYRRGANEPLESPLVVRDPLGRRHPARSRLITTFVPDHVGDHSVELEGREIAQFSVRFEDPNESNLLDRGAATGAATDAATDAAFAIAGVDASGRVEARILAILALVTLLCDWFVLARRGRGA